jgi:shikimate kinase/3-dehydroquinate synthase
MATQRPRRIFLTGFSGSGKSAVAAFVAATLGWRALDTDDIIEERSGRSIPDIFARDGEARFRELEIEALRETARQVDVVVATGGGIVQSAVNRRLMADGGFVVCLEGQPEVLWRRLRDAGGSATERPLLSGPDPLGRIRALKARRQPSYALADYTIHTDNLEPPQVAEEVLGAWRRLSARAARDPDRLSGEPASADASEGTCWVNAESARYPVYVEWGALARLGERLRGVGLSGAAHVISDDHVWHHYGEAALASPRQAGFEADSYVVPAGEASKNLTTASLLYEWLASRRAERGHAVVALGGGMVGDLAGFAAATYLRGLPLVHAPTSLLAMVDASIGGKAAVNLSEAKNLVGAFYQPRLVVTDVSALTTLPVRELTSGWAEVAKHALIMDPDLLSTLEARVADLRRLEPEVTTAVVRRNVELKAQVVSEDERETTGRRTILNYGHTVAHGLEAASEYEALLHGEAVAIGMVAAAAIGQEMGVTPAALVERQAAVLAAFGLPQEASGIDPERALAAVALDKKVSGRAVRWVLLEDVGCPVLRDDVPAALVRQAVRRACGASAKRESRRG